MTNKPTGRKIDYSSMCHAPNVDTMCDVLAAAQIEMGMQPEVVEAQYDRTGQKVNRFKRNSDGSITDSRTGNIIDFTKERDFPVIPRVGESGNATSNVRILKKKDDSDVDTIKTVKHEEPQKKERKGIVDIGFDAWYDRIFGGYDDDDDDDEYICEYCTELGYSNKYKAYICDNCTKCEACSEFQGRKCDGCTYSRARTGRLYSESLSVDQIVDPDDLELLKASEEEDHEVRRKMGNFSILDY